VSRRRALGAGLGFVASAMLGNRIFGAEPQGLALPSDAVAQTWDFGKQGIANWEVVDGQWSVQEMPGVPGWNKRVLIQQATGNTYNVIVAPLGPYRDVDVSVKFRPVSGREDASGGIVFRFSDGRYYLIRANALEDNFRLYYYDNGRRMLSSASVRAPALGQWHSVRAVAVGERVQGWLNGTLLLDYRDSRFKAGRVGLWTKADSVTAFDELTIRGLL